jgi:hypothetical protein
MESREYIVAILIEGGTSARYRDVSIANMVTTMYRARIYVHMYKLIILFIL